jgi:hypothetical protein
LYSIAVNNVADFQLATARTTMSLFKFDLGTRQLSTLGQYNAGQNGNGQIYNTSTATWNGLYSDTSGNLFASEGTSGQIWNFTITQPYTATLAAQGPISSLADGARCLNAGAILA